MNTRRRQRLATAIASLAALCAQAVAQTPAAPAGSAPSSSDSFASAFTEGKLSINARLRYETVEQDGAKDADALTARLRLGYTTKAWRGFQAMLEGEANVPLVSDYYDSTGTNTSGRAIVADPEIYEINQAWLSYAYQKTKATVGRQRIVLDNARFVGDVGWRQNQQTFDAVFVQDKTVDKLTLSYGYLARINRVFDDRAPQYDWRSDSHLLHASYAGLPFGTLAGYAYLLDFNRAADGLGAANASSQTYGLSFSGAAKLTDTVSLLYRAEYATQSDYGSSLLRYDADYYLLELGPKVGGHSLVLGYEVLGSDIGAPGSGFKTPLATLHAHNGWADKFLLTPDTGLEDLYLKLSAKLPAGFGFLGLYHWYKAEDKGPDYGTELDLQLTYQLNKNLGFTAKAAFYDGDSAAPTPALRADTNKFWLQADYVY